HFALILRQFPKRRLDELAALVSLRRRREQTVIRTLVRPGGRGLPPQPPTATAEPLEGTVLDAGKEIRLGVRGFLPRTPEANKPFLHDVLGIGALAHPLTREQNQGRTVFVQPVGPRISRVPH